MKIRYFGKTPEGKEVYAYSDDNGRIALTLLNMGGTVQSLVFEGADIVCGFDSAEQYYADGDYHGAIVGRYANRIKDAAFTINGKRYQLTRNDPWNNQLHGGVCGFNHRIWSISHEKTEGGYRFILRYLSADREEGYPGNFDATVTYTVDGSDLSVNYSGVSDRDTFVNMTNHSYFNIDGYDSGSVERHYLQIDGDRVSVFDGARITSGEYLAVAGTPFDFLAPHRIGERIDDSHPLLQITGGYGHNYMINGKTESLCGKELMHVCDYYSGKRRMTIYSDKPGLQIYTANRIGSSGIPFKGGVKQEERHAVCLEPQFEPNSCNRGEHLLRAGEKYDYTTLYRLSKI